jgi:hypothetical protein
MTYYREFIAYLMFPFGIYCVFAALPVVVALILGKERCAKWLRFATSWSVLSTVLILLTPNGIGGFSTLVSLDKNLIAFVMGIIFFIVSIPLLLIGKSKPQ